MSDGGLQGVVVDTMVISWLFDERANLLAERYRDLIGPAAVVLAFQSWNSASAPCAPAGENYDVSALSGG